MKLRCVCVIVLSKSVTCINSNGYFHLCPRMDFFKLCILITHYIRTIKMYLSNEIVKNKA